MEIQEGIWLYRMARIPEPERCVSGTAGLQGTNTQEVTAQGMFIDDLMYWSGRNGRYNMGKNSGNNGLIPGLKET